jgi:hypothetical protein
VLAHWGGGGIGGTMEGVAAGGDPATAAGAGETTAAAGDLGMTEGGQGGGWQARRGSAAVVDVYAPLLFL